MFTITIPLATACSVLAQNHSTGQIPSPESATTFRYFLQVAIAAILVVIVHVLYCKLIAYQAKTLPPVVFHWIPLFGSTASFGRHPIQFLQECQKKYGNVFTFILFGKPVTAVLGRQGNEFFFNGQPSDLSAKDAYGDFFKPVFGEGVIYDVSHAKFMEQKKFIKRYLSTEKLRKYVPMIEQEIEHYLDTDPLFSALRSEASDQWGSFDATDLATDFVIMTASRTLQGTQIRRALDLSYAQDMHDLNGGLSPINYFFQNLPCPKYWKRDRARRRVSKFYTDIIEQRRNGITEEDDMIDFLMEQTYRDGRPLGDVEVANLMVALVLGGQDSSVASTAYTLLHLAERTDIAEELYQEQVNHFTSTNGQWLPLTYEKLRALPVLQSVIRETFRVDTPAHSLMRRALHDIVVPRSLSAPSKDKVYVIPKGHLVLASPSVTHYDENAYANPTEWSPERWNDPNLTMNEDLDNTEKIDYGWGPISKGIKSPYLPFGAGMHRCIGEQFAYLQVGAIVAALIRHLEMRLDNPLPQHNYQTMVSMPVKPCNIRYKRRGVAEKC